MKKKITYTVTGSGPFPIDMLRYDRCWPRTEGDSRKIIDSFHRSRLEFTVELESERPPTDGRWLSFGYKPEVPRGTYV